MTDISNIGLLKTGSIYKTIQKGTVNKSMSGTAVDGSLTQTYEIPLSGTLNLDKTTFEHSIKVSPSGSRDHVTSSKIELKENKIVVTATFWNSDSSWASVNVSGNWIIKELF